MPKVMKLSAAVKLTMNFSCFVYSVCLPLPAAHCAVPHVMGSWVIRLKVKYAHALAARLMMANMSRA